MYHYKTTYQNVKSKWKENFTSDVRVDAQLKKHENLKTSSVWYKPDVKDPNLHYPVVENWSEIKNNTHCYMTNRKTGKWPWSKVISNSKIFISVENGGYSFAHAHGSVTNLFVAGGEHIENKIEIYSGHRSKPLHIKIIWRQIQI